MAMQAHVQPARKTSAAKQAERQVLAEQAQSAAAEADYVPLMFCDPLSCSSDTQVVRMELPAAAPNGLSQPQMADVVVGYDGAVRAVRLVN